MTRFSCIAIGEESLLIGCAETLLERGHDLRAVVSKNPAIADWAQAKGIPVLARPAGLTDAITTGAVDWLFSIANLSVLSDAVLALPAKGAINFHDGPLPAYAGLNTPVWALLNGEAQHGVTWHLIEGGIDEGDILAQAMVEIAPDETAFSLNSKCYAAGLESFSAVTAQLEAGALERTPQDLTQRSYFARDARPAAAGRLDFTRSARALARVVRALDFGDYWNPLTCPKIEVDGALVAVRKAELADMPAEAAPGTVLDFGPDQIEVATSDGVLRLSGLRPLHGGAPALRSGMVLPSPDPAEAERLDTAMRATLKGEAHWRGVLQQMHPVSVPLATTSDDAPDWTRRVLTLPSALSGADLCTAILAWALRSGGEERAALACRDTTLVSAEAQAPGYVSGWVPLTAATDATVEAAIAATRAQLEQIERVGGLAGDLPLRDPAIAGTEVPPVGIDLSGTGPIPGTCLTVSVSGEQAALYHDATRLSEAAAALLANRLEALALHVTSGQTGQESLSDLPILPPIERAKVLGDWNRTARDYDRGLTVHHAFEAQAAHSPEAIALAFEAEDLGYAALNARANAVAARLRDMGVAPGSHVGLFVERSVDLVVGALAILKAGGAYVPLDPAYPSDRIAHYLSDSQAAVVLTQAALKDRLPACPADLLIMGGEAPVPDNVDGGATADDLAYVIYTSGSTGTPKGVMVEHRNVANFFAGMDDRLDHAAGGVWLAVTSLNFDISVLEIFWTLARGFKVVLTSDENRAVVSGGPIAVSDRHIDFNLMYWGNDDGPGPKKYELLLEGAKFADAHGFNAVWTPERHFHAFGGPYPNPSVTGAAVAAVTQNLAVRAGSCVAPLHHPARIAEEWAVIDNLTNGRTGLGIASGWQPDDFVLRPENAPPNNKPAMFEAIEILRKLWRGEKVAFPRKDGSLHEVVTQPRPVSRELPVWVTTAGNPETWKEAGQIGANVLTHLLGQSIDEVAGKIRLYHAALRENGHDPADFTVTLMLHTYLAETREESERIARGPMKDYLRSAAGLIKQYAWAFPAFKKPEGVNNSFELDLGILGEDELEAILDFAFERYFEDSGLFGTIEDGIARVEQLKRIGVDEVACLIDYGIAPDVVLEGLKPLAEVLRRMQQPSALAEDDFSLAAQIVRHGVTHMQCTPSMARMIAMNDEARMALGRVRHLLLGGEALPGDLVEDLRECTGAKVLNMYGPTETTIWSTCEEVGAGARGTVGIGTPIANTSVYVLDAAGQPAPVGVPGELHIGGEGVTRGYWQRPDLTEDRFLRDPFAAEAGLTIAAAPRMYRTGDLVRWGEDGQLDFLGRTDHQVKIRGQRIELGEIEAALSAHAGVAGAVAIAHKISGDTRLVAYITTAAPVSDAGLRAHLEARLPAVMVPAHIVTLDAFPLTPNRKIDRKALPDPVARRAAAAPVAAAAPTGGNATLETGIAEIWSRILGVGDIRPEDSFFDLGGHSLLAVQAHREIRDKLNLPKLAITDIFRFPTLAGLAAHAGKGSDAPQPAAQAAAEPADRQETMSKRRAMRAGRKVRG